MELHKGRPADKRIDKEERCYALLDSLGIEYYRVDHEHADTIEACHGIESVLGCGICKNLFLCNRSFIFCSSPATSRSRRSSYQSR